MGTLVQTIYESEAAELRMLGEIGCEVTTLGNHEFDYRLPRLEELVGMMNTKPVCCNFQKIGENESYFEPYSIVSYGDVDIELFSIYDIFTWNGLRPTDADQTLRVLFLEPSRAKLINLTSEQAVMELSNLTRDEKGQKIEFARNYVRPDKIEFFTHYARE